MTEPTAVPAASTSPAPTPPHVQPTVRDPDAHPRIALVGNPNTGKTTLFNRLCGLRAKTANFPGTTTDAKVGRWTLGEVQGEVVDLPGIYRLCLDLPESRVCRDVLEGHGLYRQPDLVVVVVDATNLTRNLVLVAELLARRLPTVVALNMLDLAQRRGLTVDHEPLARQLGCPVVPIMARRGDGLDELAATVARRLAGEAGEGAPATPLPATDTPDPEQLEAWAEGVVEVSIGGPGAVGAATDTVTDRLDEAFTHPVLGVVIFVAVMGGLFWSIFAFATLPMNLIEATFTHLGGWTAAAVPAGPVRDLLVDGVIGGVAGTVVFLPQICLLFFLLTLLEDTGYLARAAFVMDRILYRFGLPGHAFVPLLSSHACAIPGIMSARLIPDRKDRLATILVAPFMSCSARLPVYVLLTGLLFAGRPLLAGLAFAGCYVLGAAAALGSAFLARRTVAPGRSQPMVLELPSYKLPSLRNAVYTAVDQGVDFLRKAGTVIVAICVVMWWLSAYPKSAPPPEAQQLAAQAEQLAASDPAAAAALTERADALTATHAQASSFAGRLGHLVQPVFAPLGYDWQLTVGVLTSFVAREVFVSTMAVLLTGTEEPDLTGSGIIDTIRTAERDDGTPVFTIATSASALIFFVLAMQCLPTLAVTSRETGSWRWAALQLVYMSALAYLAALVTYRGLLTMGFS